MPEHVRLGRALAATPGPLTVRAPSGTVHAVWPYGPGAAPHALVIGSTGGGKTTLLRYVTTQLLRAPGPKALSLACGKGAGSFRMFQDVPGVAAVANTPAETTAMAAGFYQLVEGRYRDLAAARDLLAAGRPASYARPGPAWLVVDEYLTFILGVPDTRPQRLRTQLIAGLVRVGAVGREVNCRLVVATQRPDAKSVDTGLPGILMAQLKCRIAATGVMGMDSVEARMAFDDADARRVPSRVGGGLVKVGRHEAAFVTPFMADPTDPATSEADRDAARRLLPRHGIPA